MNGIEYRFQPGDVAYWHRQTGNNHYVGYGIVDEHYSDAVCVDLLETKECRYIDGVPLNDVPSVGKWHKLPKGWTYNTQLYELEWRSDPMFATFVFNIKDPENVKEAFKRGYLIRAIDKFQGNIETEITKEGWRLVKRYDPHKIIITSTSIRPYQCYTTFEEAQKEVDDYKAELQRQANLTDYEWSVELIDKELNRWQKLYGVPEDEKQKCRKWLLGMDNVEDLEVRLSMGGIQWKYDRNKKWRNIEL